MVRVMVVVVSGWVGSWVCVCVCVCEYRSKTHIFNFFKIFYEIEKHRQYKFG